MFSPHHWMPFSGWGIFLCELLAGDKNVIEWRAWNRNWLLRNWSPLNASFWGGAMTNQPVWEAWTLLEGNKIKKYPPQMQFVFEKREGSSHFIASFFSKTSRKCLTKRNLRPSHHLFHAWMQITVGFSSCESKKKRIFIVIPHKNHCKYGSNYSQCSVFFLKHSTF